MPGHARLQKIAPVARAEWPELLDRFSRTNKGRTTKLQYFGGRSGTERIEEGLPLLGIVYNTRGDADMLTISFGKGTVEYEHRVEQPREVWIEQHQEAEGDAMEIVDQDGGHLVITLQ